MDDALVRELKAKRDLLVALLVSLESLHLQAGEVQANEAKGQDLRKQVAALNRAINRE